MDWPEDSGWAMSATRLADAAGRHVTWYPADPAQFRLEMKADFASA
jgi:hypothetical protein